MCEDFHIELIGYYYCLAEHAIKIVQFYLNTTSPIKIFYIQLNLVGLLVG